MKKTFLTVALSVTAVAVIATLKIAPQSEIAATENNASSENAVLYIVKETEGKIAVFESGKSEPLYYLEEVVFKTLPEYDRQLLKSGIKVKTDKELQKVIEDYDG